MWSRGCSTPTPPDHPLSFLGVGSHQAPGTYRSSLWPPPPASASLLPLFGELLCRLRFRTASPSYRSQPAHVCRSISSMTRMCPAKRVVVEKSFVARVDVVGNAGKCCLHGKSACFSRSRSGSAEDRIWYNRTNCHAKRLQTCTTSFIRRAIYNVHMDTIVVCVRKNCLPYYSPCTRDLNRSWLRRSRIFSVSPPMLMSLTPSLRHSR